MSVQVTSDQVVRFNVQIARSHRHCDQSLASCKSWSCSTFETKLWVVTQSQRGSRSFEHAVVESLSVVVIFYHFLLKEFEENDINYSNDCIFPYLPIKRVGVSRQSRATYLATDSLRLGRSCKPALKLAKDFLMCFDEGPTFLGHVTMRDKMRIRHFDPPSNCKSEIWKWKEQPH